MVKDHHTYNHSGVTSVYFIKIPKGMKGRFPIKLYDSFLDSTENMGSFKKDYKLQMYDYPINML